MEPTEQPVHDFNTQVSSQSAKFNLTNKLILIFFGAVVLGVLTGFGLSRNNGNSLTSTNNNSVTDLSNVEKGTIIGSDDTKTFKDQVEGILKVGGIEGEGAFHLVRPGGESQNVYLTSSIVDLAGLVDRKIKVWGETQKAQSAGWLMDVGRVEVLQ